MDHLVERDMGDCDGFRHRFGNGHLLDPGEHREFPGRPYSASAEYHWRQPGLRYSADTAELAIEPSDHQVGLTFARRAPTSTGLPFVRQTIGPIVMQR